MGQMYSLVYHKQELSRLSTLLRWHKIQSFLPWPILSLRFVPQMPKLWDPMQSSLQEDLTILIRSIMWCASHSYSEELLIPGLPVLTSRWRWLRLLLSLILPNSLCPMKSHVLTVERDSHLAQNTLCQRPSIPVFFMLFLRLSQRLLLPQESPLNLSTIGLSTSSSSERVLCTPITDHTPILSIRIDGC